MTTEYPIAERSGKIANTVGSYLKEGNLEAILTFFYPILIIFSFYLWD